MKPLWTLKQKIGAIIYDLPRFFWAARPNLLLNVESHPWVFMHNRNEKIICDDKNIGVACDWHWTSDLHIAKVFPSLGLMLMRKTLEDWPIKFQSEPHHANDIEASFIIGHRGKERLPHLLVTLQTIAAQKNVSLECIVVEQSEGTEIKEFLPSWVDYIHSPLPYPDMPYCRSWAFNVGARATTADILVFHDNDMMVPQAYAFQLMKRFNEGYDVINLKRFIFYLNRAHTERILSSQRLLLNKAPETIVQNLEAGGSVAIRKKAFFEIGGFDESFVGWGGEDVEFWERAQTRKVWPYSYLPFVHLWHSPQPGKFDDSLTRKGLYWKRSKEPAEIRIKRLINLPLGNTAGPVSVKER